MNLLISLIPIAFPFIFLVLLKLPAKRGMLYSFTIMLFASLVFWGMEFNVVIASIIQGTHKALGILLILFGAIMLMNILKKNGAIDRINLAFNALTQDMRIQAVIIAYLFGALIEGVAGFGTPAVVVAPLLVALGFSPIGAASVALISNSVPVPFAAVGTPVAVGLGNISNTTEFYNEIAKYITSIDMLAGVFMPTIIVFILVKFFGKGSTKQDFFEILPWTLMVGALYSLSAFIFARTVGYEFISIFTSIAMISITTLSVRFRVLVPKKIWTKANTYDVEISESNMNLLVAWSPYLIVIILLIASRIIEPIKVFSKTFIDLSISNIMGVDGVSSGLQLLYSPGTILIFAAISSVYIQRVDKSNIKFAFSKTFKNVKGAALSLIPTLAMVQIFSNSGMNLHYLSSMPVYLANYLGIVFNNIWTILAPFIGELGSFIAGSATVSALTFSPIQFQIANEYGFDAMKILALGLMGGAAGNMICVHNVVSVSTVVNVEGKEGEVIKKTLIPAILYCLLLGVSAIIIF